MSAEAELARLERQILGAPRVGGFVAQVRELRRMLATADPRIRERVLKLTAPAIGRDLAAAVSAAWSIGVDDAVTIIGQGEPKSVPKAVPKRFVVLARAAEKSLAGLVADARRLARTGAAPDVVLSKVFAAETALKRDVVTAINAAGNAATTAVADATRRPTVWVAETNACVTCLAYSGRVAKPGEAFPAGRSYGPRSTVTEAIPHPPAHPNCRCTVEPLNDQSYADALRREADRSVLRGFSLESESMKVRIEAADRLVSRGVTAPKSVIEYARRAVKAGEFPTRGRP